MTHAEVCALGGGPSRTVTARQFVLACGAIENARLLLVSRDVEPHGIGNARDQVGRFFMEHPTGRIGKVETAAPADLWALFQKRFMKGGVPLAPLLRLSDAVQRERSALNSIVTFKLQRDPRHGVALGNKLYHNLKHSLQPNRRGRALDHLYRGLRGWFHRTVREPLEHARAKYAGAGLYLILRGEQAPNPDSRVVLSDKHDALGNCRADLDWQLGDLDKHTARVFAEVFDAEMKRMGQHGVTPKRLAGRARHRLAGRSHDRQPPDRRLPYAGWHPDRQRPGNQRRRCRMPGPRLCQPVGRRQLDFRHRRLGQSDADAGGAGDQTGGAVGGVTARLGGSNSVLGQKFAQG